MITSNEIEKLSTKEVEVLFNICKDVLSEREQSEPMTFDRLTSYKNRVSPQKFSPYFERQCRQVLGLQISGNSIYSPFDGTDEKGLTYELKYATYSEARGASFPQLMRLDVVPHEYFIVMFYGNELEIYRVPGVAMHKSIIRFTSTPAHADNQKERRINIKNNTPQMDFLKQYRDTKLETRFKKHTFESP